MRERLSLLALLLLLGACEDRGRVREWRPEDHGQPTSAQAADSSGRQPAPRNEAEAAMQLFGMLCARCHGPRGQGDGPERPAGVELVDLSSAEWQSSRTDAELAQVIATGRNEMPEFGSQVSPIGIAALVRHLRSLGP